MHLLFVYFTLLGGLLMPVCADCSFRPLGLAGRFCGALAGRVPALGTLVYVVCVGPKPLDVLLLILSAVGPLASC